MYSEVNRYYKIRSRWNQKFQHFLQFRVKSRVEEACTLGINKSEAPLSRLHNSGLALKRPRFKNWCRCNLWTKATSPASEFTRVSYTVKKTIEERCLKRMECQAAIVSFCWEQKYRFMNIWRNITVFEFFHDIILKYLNRSANKKLHFTDISYLTGA